MAEYTISGNALIFNQDVNKWSTGETNIGSNKFEFSNCNITSGISITFEFTESITKITVSDCTINKSCTIGSNITNCEYDSKGTLKINAGQSSSPFKFNKISISGGGSDAISKSGVTINSDDHELNISGSNYGIQNSGTTITINNYGTMSISSSWGNGIQNHGTMIINNYGMMNVNRKDGVGIVCNGTMIFKNSSIININGTINAQGETIINISDSLFLVKPSSTRASIGFSSTPSTWNGRTFVNTSSFSNFTKASITSYFDNYPSSITLQSGEQVFNKLENNSEKPILYELQSKGTLILQPKSSLEVSDPFELPQGSTLICSKDTKINNSQIQGESSVLLKSELKDKTITNGKVIF